MNVSLVQAVYITEEADLSVEVCVSLTGGLEREAVVSISTEDSTAMAEADYVSLSSIVTFIPGDLSQVGCMAVAVNQDQTLENNETFLVVISSSDPGIDIALQESTVIVIDSDREFILL